MHNVDAALHVRGESEYVDDLPRPEGLLHAAVFASPVASGTIRHLNCEDARQMDGVEAVLTAVDIPGENQVGPIIQDEVLLAEHDLSFIGQPIALVVARSPELARKAVRRIQIEVDEEKPVIDPREAFERGQIIGTPRTFALGDVDTAWGKCDWVAEGRCEIGGQEHVYLETQRARAVPGEGCLRIHSSTQGPYAAQKGAARILGIPLHRIEVDVRRLGGGFGGKEDQATIWACMAALGAWHTGRPVEIVLRRSEDVAMTGKRHPYSSDFKIGLDRQGRILAFEANHFQNSGAAADLSTAVLERTLFHSTNSYFIPNVRISAACCRTNLPPSTAFRGFGGPQGMFVIECAIAKAAELTGLPREEIQRRNLLGDGDHFPYGQEARQCRAQRCWDEASQVFKLEEWQRDVDRFNAGSVVVKRGLAVMPVCFGISFTAIPKNQAGALVHVYTDGSVGVSTGGVEMGQGLNTNVALVVAQVFGISPERVRVESTNTTRVANTSPSAASATTLLNGNAARLAAEQILERLRRSAAFELRLDDPSKIAIRLERVFCDGKETEFSWSQLVMNAHLARVSLSSHAFFATPDIWFDRQRETGQPFAYHTYGTAVVEVMLDCLRGRFSVDKVRIVHDLGRPLNRRVDLGQVEGGLAQGLGWMTMEELRWDAGGRLESGALATYKVPDAYFMPDHLDVRFLEDSPGLLGPFGSKAVGEPPLMYGIGVFFALRAAMQAFRPDQYPFESPLTPERILMQTHSRQVDETEQKLKRAGVTA